MPRPSLAVLAILSLGGLVAAGAVLAQGIPGLPVVIDDGRTNRPARPAPAKAKGLLLDRVVATVNEGIVMQSQLEEALANAAAEAKQEGKRLPPADQLRSRLLDQLITRELLLQRAKRIPITISDEDMGKTLDDIARTNKLKLDDLPDAIRSMGIDFDAYRDGLREDMMIGRLEYREVRQHINVTPRELEQHMERLRKLPNKDDIYEISDILISVPAEATRAQQVELEKKAQGIYERTASEDFASLAQVNSDARTASRGGKLEPRPAGELPTELVETIVKLKPGEVSPPILITSGWHIVKVDAVQRADGDALQEQVRLRHILRRITDLEDDATVRLKLAGWRQRILNGEDFTVLAKAMSQDPGSQADGGELPWISLDEPEDPAFRAVIRTLKDNEISEPFQTSSGWHIVQMLEHRKADTTEDILRERAFIQLRNSKADEEIELWRRRMRDEAFIQIVEPKT